MAVDVNSDTKPVGSYPRSGIKVLIVGTGLAGLTAAIECVRKGHDVHVLERNDGPSSAGDMYFMGISATKFFKHWPDMSRHFDHISMEDVWLETYKHHGERTIPPMKADQRLREDGQAVGASPGAFQMRPLVYRMLLDQAEKMAGVVTEQGDRFQADVVIAADGVGSKSQKIVGGQVRAMKSGRAMWRAAFPAHHLDQNPQVRAFFSMHDDGSGEKPTVRTWLGPGTYAVTLRRPDTMAWIINHDATGTEEESWSHTVMPDDVLANLDKGIGDWPWAPVFKDLIKLTPPHTIVDFEVLWRNPQPSWASPGNRVVQIGDAAHSFLPASGNGATQAMEDGVCLAACLQMGGQMRVPESVRAHVSFRFVRTACAQKMGFLNAGLLQDTDWGRVRLNMRRAAPRMPRWLWSHDPEEYVHLYYDKAVESIRKGALITEDDSFPPNYPAGYKYEPWSIERIMEDVRSGRPLDLGLGEWDAATQLDV